MKIKKMTGPKIDLEGHQIVQGLDLRLGHLTPLFESAQRAMKQCTCLICLLEGQKLRTAHPLDP